jgi:hypothetical protein
MTSSDETAVQRTIRGIRIGIPWTLAVIAPVVMAEKYAGVYSHVWDTIPATTQAVIKYGLFMRGHLWLAILVGAVILGVWQVAVHRMAEPMKRMFLALHLSGVLVAILIIFSFYLPSALRQVR